MATTLECQGITTHHVLLDRVYGDTYIFELVKTISLFTRRIKIIDVVIEWMDIG